MEHGLTWKKIHFLTSGGIYFETEEKPNFLDLGRHGMEDGDTALLLVQRLVEMMREARQLVWPHMETVTTIRCLAEKSVAATQRLIKKKRDFWVKTLSHPLC